MSLLLKKRQAQLTAVMNELALRRRNSRQESGVPAKPTALSETVASPIWKPDNIQSEALEAAVKRKSSVNGSAMWRQRYEHLARLLGDVTKTDAWAVN